MFFDSGDNTFSHVGFNWKGDLYESSLPYTGGKYWDVALQGDRTINPDNGV
ncbi:MAG: hypothetical protein SW833_00240 [Cyanobacteriota bacterium]|nr:hypothetical protein [Cyanobacteriota bacterium]